MKIELFICHDASGRPSARWLEGKSNVDWSVCPELLGMLAARDKKELGAKESICISEQKIVQYTTKVHGALQEPLGIFWLRI